MEKFFSTLLFLFCSVCFAQCKIDILQTILNEHIERELPQLGLKREELIISVNLIGDDKKNLVISIDASPVVSYQSEGNIKIIRGVKVKFYYKNVSKKLIKDINKIFKGFDYVVNVADNNLVKLTHYRGAATFQLNKKNEFYIISTSDDDYYYEVFKQKKLKFSKDLKFTKDILKEK